MKFINLTNHPSDHWSADQLDAAHRFGEIEDLPFPAIDDAINADDVRALAEKYCGMISLVASPQDAVIHIMGEMTFTFSLVTELKKLGYKCVASTSKRIVEMQPDGSKNVKFEFCQFREY